MTIQEEQETFAKFIQENFISLFDLIENIKQEKNISINEAGLYLLTRINDYKGNLDEICCALVEPPFIRYSLSYISKYELVDVIKFIVNNGRFRSEKKAKKHYGLIKSEIKNILMGNHQTESNSQTVTKDYHPSERETHLQMIAILAEELAKISNTAKYRKASGLPNHSALSELISMRAKEIEIEALTSKSVDTYRRRLTEVSKFYKGE